MRNLQYRCNYFIVALFFLFLATTLIALSWGTISATGYETGDFAANSVLIQSAKSFKLLKGHYSRLGFNHPGPAILYILAVGELAFHDWMNLVTPIGGQIISVTIYSTIWLSLILIILLRLTHDLRITIIFISVFIMSSAFLDHDVFNGLWFAHLYYFPFATFTVALAAVALGEADVLPILAVAAGFLINGHISFVPVLGIMLVLVLLFHTWLACKTHLPWSSNWLSLEFIKRHSHIIFLSLCLGGVFLVPLTLETVFHPPGPIPSYLAFAENNQVNDLYDTFKFILNYFGGTVYAMIGLLGFLVTIFICHRRQKADLWVVTIIVALIAQFLATFIFVLRGVDDLRHIYVAIYFYSLPALSISLVSVCAYVCISEKYRRYFLVLIPTLCFFVAAMNIRKPPVYLNGYNAAQVPELYSKMIQLGSNLVLNLDSSPDAWVDVWATIVGVEALGSRMKHMPFCIEKNWHILFTPEMKCTESQLKNGRRALVTKSGSNASSYIEPLFEVGDITVGVAKPLKLERFLEYRVGQNTSVFSSSVLAGGWSEVEGDFVWSVGPEAQLDIQVPAGSKKISIDLASFVPGNKTQQVKISVDGIFESSVVFNALENRQSITIDLGVSHSENRLITFGISEPLSPKKLGLSNDTRELGVALYGFRID